MKLTSTGLGIGTTAPQYKLHVSGGLSLFNSSTAGSDGNSGIRIVSPIATTHYNWMLAAQQNVGAAFEITPSTAVGGTTFTSPAMVVKATGEVGIGTTSPSAKLVVNPIVTDASVHTYSANATVLTHQTATSTTVLNDPQEVLVLARQGTSGQAYGAAVALQLSRYKNTGVDSNTRLDFVLANTAYLSGPNTVMTLQSEGRVGIGTTNPSASLHVSGTMMVQSVIEKVSVTASAPPATLNYNVLDQAILFHSASTSANWTLNFRGNASTTLNSTMYPGQSLTATVLVLNAATAYSSSTYQIDGTAITPRWQGGISGSANTNSLDAHTFTIIKTSATPTYVLLGSITKYT
jgi:hypothetical protein